MILVIDNFDSFVHNLARYFERLGERTLVLRNDAISTDAIRAMSPEAIVFSPGPCTPREAGASLEVVRALHEVFPMLGVCLGHQTIAEALGGRIVRARRPMHGRASRITHSEKGLFEGVASPLVVGRYHSLVVDADALPSSLAVTAQADDGTIMALAHRTLPVYGVQFHPESIMTESGYEIVSNFLNLAGLGKHSVESLPRGEIDPAPPKVAPPCVPVTF